jgi:putative FmdB family regulatory protein
MPTYHYRCKSCAHEFDHFQKFSEDPLTVCPECGQEIRRVIQPVGVVFKGSGWYITDSRPKPSDANGAKSDDKPAEKAEKTESKSETKAESTPAKGESTEKKAAASA